MSKMILVLLTFSFLSCGTTNKPAVIDGNSGAINSGNVKEVSLATISNEEILGIWDLNIQTPRGNNSRVLTITEENGQLKGETNDSNFNIEREKNQLTWTSKIKSPMGGTIEAAHKVFVNDGKLSGSLSAMGRTIEVSGKKRD
ncbi:MAG: hypothetical protein AAF242_05960 [Bacteroidota bacterium]